MLNNWILSVNHLSMNLYFFFLNNNQFYFERNTESLSGVEITLDSVIGPLQVKLHQLDIPVVKHHLQLRGIRMDLLPLTWSQTPARFLLDRVIKVVLADEVALFPRDNLAEVGLASELLLLAVVDMVEDETR